MAVLGPLFAPIKREAGRSNAGLSSLAPFLPSSLFRTIRV